jgi:hypothetical protein
MGTCFDVTVLAMRKYATIFKCVYPLAGDPEIESKYVGKNKHGMNSR